MIQQHIAISGELGSGKSTVAKRLAEAHGHRLVVLGDIHRSIAQSMNMTILEQQHLAEQDHLIDARVDAVTQGLDGSPEPIVFDGRMAWRMAPSSFKIHLVVDAVVAATRLHATRSSPVEGYGSVAEARAAAEARYQIEQRRYLSKYHVDISRLKNYHLVIDTSQASVDEVVSGIEAEVTTPTEPAVRLKVSPRRILPGPPLSPIPETRIPHVVYIRPFFIAVNGHASISAALHAHRSLLDVILVAEGDEDITPGLSVSRYSEGLDLDEVQKWAASHGFAFADYPGAVRA